MKRAFLAAMVLVCVCAGIAFGESARAFRQRVDARLDAIEHALKQRGEKAMAGTTIDADLDVYQDANDPSVPGDIKIVKGTVLELDDCDADTQWSVESGAGVTLALDAAQVYEGTGSIRVDVPAGVTAIVTVTKASGSWDLSSYKFLKAMIRRNAWLTTPYFYCGETTYNEQSTTPSLPSADVWTQFSWDISGIAAASRNAVTMASFRFWNTDFSAHSFYVDFVYADPGPSQVKAFDGDRVILLYPKFYRTTYTGNASDNRAISIPRKGKPSRVTIDRSDNDGNSIQWIEGYAANTAKDLTTGVLVTNRIKTVSDGGITVGTDNTVNGSSPKTYILTAEWED